MLEDASTASGKSRSRDGRIEIIIGPMFSGKTSELLRRLKRHQLANKKVVLVKYAKDQRYDGSDTQVITHDQNGMKATISTLSLTHSIQNSDEFEDADVVGIDEA